MLYGNISGVGHQSQIAFKIWLSLLGEKYYDRNIPRE